MAQSEFSNLRLSSSGDEWYTLEEDVEILIPYLRARNYNKILCPFDTEQSKFVEVLKDNGFKVTFSHIWEGVDFFNYSLEELRQYDAVISNPPFSKRTKIFKRLFEAQVPFAMICNSNGVFDSKERWELFKSYDFSFIIPKGRMRFVNQDNTIKNSPNFQSIYICNGITNNKFEFVERTYRKEK